MKDRRDTLPAFWRHAWPPSFSPQPLDHKQGRQVAKGRVAVRLAVGRHGDALDPDEAGEIRRSERPPQLRAAACDIRSKNLRRNTVGFEKHLRVCARPSEDARSGRHATDRTRKS